MGFKDWCSVAGRVVCYNMNRDRPQRRGVNHCVRLTRLWRSHGVWSRCCPPPVAEGGVREANVPAGLARRDARRGATPLHGCVSDLSNQAAHATGVRNDNDPGSLFMLCCCRHTVTHVRQMAKKQPAALPAMHSTNRVCSWQQWQDLVTWKGVDRGGGVGGRGS